MNKQHVRQFKSNSVVSNPAVIVDVDLNKDLGFVVVSVVLDPGPCCCDWLHGGCLRVCAKSWQSDSGRRH